MSASRFTSTLLFLSALPLGFGCADMSGDDEADGYRWGGGWDDDDDGWHDDDDDGWHDDDDDDGHHHHDDDGRIKAKAGFSCDFGIDPDTPFEIIPPTIERDRMFMADQPGLVHGKHLPLSIDLSTGALYGGGRYLFKNKHTASDYKDWVTEGYVLDGVQFLDRPEVFDPDCHDWQNIGAFELGDINSDHIVMRTERWKIPHPKNHTAEHFLKSYLPELREQAESFGLTGVWLLYNKQERLAEIVVIDDRVAEPLPGQLDFDSFFALQLAPSFGDPLTAKGWTKVLDRTHFLLSIWFPFELGDQGEPSLWPNSPPLPEPFCTDGVCEVSRGEDSDTCPVDCPANCGDAVCQAGEGEGTSNCPGDCRL